MLLGVLIFIDDYFNCLTVGAVMRPVTESHKISRAKLAYIIDATAAPVCMLAPVSSWAAAVASYVPDGFPGSRISMFLSQIPFNYYCILTLVMVIVTSVLNIDYGPMLTHEYNAQVKDDLFTTPERPFAGADDYEEGEKHSSVLDLLVPVIVLIALCIVGLIWTGGMWDAESENYHNFIMSFSDASAGTGLGLGSIIALVFTFVYYWLRGLITFEKSMEAIPNGFIQMISPILILCFAWTLCGLCRDNGLQVGSFVEGVMANTGSLAKFLPAVIFIVACFIGSPQMNFFDGELEKKDGKYQLKVGEATVVLGDKAQELLVGKGVGERKVTVGIRPEHIAFAAAPGSDTVSSKVDVSEMMGSEVYLHVNAVGRDVVLRIPTTDLPAEHRAGIPYGTEINFAFRPDLIHLFDPETEKNLMY